MRRIVVVGTTGSGKTTLARGLAGRLGIPHAELDALYWGPDWTPNPSFLGDVRGFVTGEAWVLDGGYAQARPIVWGRADTIVWLDFPMSLVCARVVRRTFARWWDGQVLWNGNRERLWTQLATRDSLFLWVAQTWRKRRAKYPKLLASPQFAYARCVRLRSPGAAQRWLDVLPVHQK